MENDVFVGGDFNLSTDDYHFDLKKMNIINISARKPRRLAPWSVNLEAFFSFLILLTFFSLL